MSKYRYILTDDEQFRIEGIVARLSNAVNTYEVLQWLENFDAEDRPLALTILEHMKYYTVPNIYETIKKAIDDISTTYQRCYIYFVPIARLGKSGSLVSYYVKRTLPKGHRRFKVVSAEEIGKKKNISPKSVLCLMDDFTGSGKTFKDFYAPNAASFSRFRNKIALFLEYMPQGEEVIRDYGFEIYGTIHYPVFPRRNSIFGGELKMKQIREFAYKYGSMLYPRSKVHDSQQPLGYANSQALIAFDYTTPNNTLPIIWASKKTKRNREWHPLFPRKAEDFVKRLASVRRNYWLWWHEYKQLKSPFIRMESDEAYTIERVRIFLLLDLIQTRKDRSTWEQLLGIPSSELSAIIKKAKEFHFVDDNMHLMPDAERMLHEVNKSRKIQAEEKEEIQEDISAYTYVPKQFKKGRLLNGSVISKSSQEQSLALP